MLDVKPQTLYWTWYTIIGRIRLVTVNFNILKHLNTRNKMISITAKMSNEVIK